MSNVSIRLRKPLSMTGSCSLRDIYLLKTGERNKFSSSFHVFIFQLLKFSYSKNEEDEEWGTRDESPTGNLTTNFEATAITTYATVKINHV